MFDSDFRKAVIILILSSTLCMAVFVGTGWNGCCVWLTCSSWTRQHCSGII